jgi:hypothetical protein
LLIGQLPQDTALSMVALVGASLVLALVVGLLALRTPGAVPHRTPPVSPTFGSRLSERE